MAPLPRCQDAFAFLSAIIAELAAIKDALFRAFACSQNFAVRKSGDEQTAKRINEARWLFRPE